MSTRTVKIKILVDTEVNDREADYGLTELLHRVQAAAHKATGDEDVIATYKIMPRSGTLYYHNLKHAKP